MLLSEAQSLIKDKVTVEILDEITPLYYLLNLDKSIFAEIINKVGLAAVRQHSVRYALLLELFDVWEEAKSQNEKDLVRLSELDAEKKALQEKIRCYETMYNKGLYNDNT